MLYFAYPIVDFLLVRSLHYSLYKARPRKHSQTIHEEARASNLQCLLLNFVVVFGAFCSDFSGRRPFFLWACRLPILLGFLVLLLLWGDQPGREHSGEHLGHCLDVVAAAESVRLSHLLVVQQPGLYQQADKVGRVKCSAVFYHKVWEAKFHNIFCADLQREQVNLCLGAAELI